MRPVSQGYATHGPVLKTFYDADLPAYCRCLFMQLIWGRLKGEVCIRAYGKREHWGGGTGGPIKVYTHLLRCLQLLRAK